MGDRALGSRYAGQVEAGGGKPGPERLRAELAAELGIANRASLDAVIALGITAEIAPAFESLPWVEVAWADGDVDTEERWRVLEEAHEVAAAAGGFFGFGSVSGSERAAVERIGESLGGRGTVHVG